jgi:PAS domain S-box-containing protein
MEEKLKLLILEDVLEDLELVLYELRQAKIQFNHLHVENEEEFKKGLIVFKPDLILSDYKLPQFTGLEALLITKEISPLTPFIIVTGSMNEETAVDCMKAGAWDYVIKEHLGRLAGAVSQALEKKVLIDKKIEAEEYLISSEERLKILFDYAPDAYYLHDPKGNFVDVNIATQKLLGYDKNELIGNGFFKLNLLSPDQISKAVKLLTKNSIGQSIGPDEFVLNRKDKSKVTVEIIAHPIKINGKTLVLGIAHDITERKRAENSIIHLNTVLKAIRDVNQLIVKEKDIEALIKKSCEILTETRGYSIAYITLFDENGRPSESSKNIDDSEYKMFIKQIKKGTWKGICRKALDHQGIIQIDNPANECKDCPLQSFAPKMKALATRLEYGGKVFGLFTVGIPERIQVNSDEKVLFNEVASDISFALHAAEIEKNRKQAEEALKESEARFRVFFESSPEGILIADVETKMFKYANPSMCRMLGYTENELITMNVGDVHPKDALQSVIAEFKAQARGEKILAENLPCLRKDGTVFYADINTVKIIIDDKACNLGFFSDITNRKKIENKLRDSEIRYRNLFESSSEFLFTFDLKGNFTDVNKAAEEITGYTKAELLKMSFKDYTPKKDHKKLSRAFLDIYKTGRVLHDLPVKAFMKDGSMKYFETSFSLLKKGEQVIGFQGSSRDITERKKAEEVVKSTKAFLDSVINTIADPVFVKDSNRKFILVNDALCDVVGRSREELLGKDDHDMFPKEQADVFRKADLEVLKTGEENLNEELLTNLSTGEEQTIVTHKSRYIDPSGKHFLVGTIRDITERKRANERQRLITQVTSDLIYEWDIQSDSLEWFGNLDEQLGYKPGEISRTIEAWIKLIHPDDARNLSNSVKRHRESTEPIYEEYRVQKKDGTWMYWSDRGIPILNSEGHPVKWIGACKDITERKKAEEKLRLNEASLRGAQRIANIGNWSFDLTTGNVRMSEEMFNLIGIKNKSEDLDVSQHEKYYTPESWKVFQNALKEAQEKGKVYEIEMEFANKDAEFRYAIARGEPVYDENNNLIGLKGTLQDITERKIAEIQIQRDLKEKTLLLQEVHHRTKNNLQTICSLMQMQENTIHTKEDALQGFKVTQDRIRAMAKAYEILLRSDYMSEIKLNDYITELADELARNYHVHRKVNIKYSMDDVLFDAEKLSKLGLIINEIITNSMKYAFEGRDEGNIHINLKDAKDHITIKISDDGIGIPESIKIPNTKTLGLSLVDMLMGEFHGTYSIDRKKGTSFILNIPKERKE